MITNADITKLKDVFATKEDLKSFATKDDLKAFATKDDLKGFATKDDLKGFATQQSLDEAIADVKIEFGEVHDKIDTIAATVARIENAIDKLSGNIEDLRLENAAGNAHLARHDRQIEVLARETGVTIPN